jgi:hypothetical protein
MNEIPSVGKDYLAQLLKRRDGYRPEEVSKLKEVFRGKKRKPPEVFHDSSFLYIRSYDGDIGNRPFSNIVFWRSPDVTLSPLTNLGAFVTTLNAGETYLVRINLRNRGDIPAPSAKVELFLVTPSLGFSTQFATKITLGNVPSVFVPSLGAATAQFLYTVPADLSGHRCLFARVFSFSPLDLPIDDFALDPRIDRHVAQQNLDIVGQAMAYSFNLVHQPNAKIRIALRAFGGEDLLALRHPILGELVPAKEFPRRGWGRIAPIHPRKVAGEFDISEAEDGLTLFTKGDGMGLDEQRKLTQEMRRVLAEIDAGKAKASSHKELFAQFRKMNAGATQSTFTMKIPDLNLQKGQAIGLDITATDENLAEDQIFGGITLIIAG